MTASATLSNSSYLDSLVSKIFDKSLGITASKDITGVSSDLEIIHSIARGCRENYSFLVEKYYNPIFNYVLRSVNFHNETSQDLTSETFYKAYLNLNRYQSHTKFSSWLYKIAHNLLIDHYRAFKGTADEIDTISDNETSLRMVSRLSEDALNTPINSEELLNPVLNALDKEDRQLILLFYIEELSIQELASIYDVFPGTIKTRLHRARNKAKSIILNNIDDQNASFTKRVESFMNNVSSVFNSSKHSTSS